MAAPILAAAIPAVASLAGTLMASAAQKKQAQQAAEQAAIAEQLRINEAQRQQAMQAQLQAPQLLSEGQARAFQTMMSAFGRG